MIILIPAYKPDEKFLRFLDDIYSRTDFKVVAVDDGGGSAFDSIFEAAASKGVEVIRYEKNRGKGGALKVGFRYIAEHYPNEYVVTADCDGQHTVPDILSVASRLEGKKNTLVLGCRSIKDMPLRSKAGNTITKIFFCIFTGKLLTETQTGVRGVTPDLFLPFCDIKGDRFEYEMNMLIKCVDDGVCFDEAPISTTYIEDNKSTHFNGLRDGYRIYSLMVKSRAAEFLGFFAFNIAALLLSLLFTPESYSLIGISLTAVCALSLRFIVMFVTKAVSAKNLLFPYRLRDVVCGAVCAAVIIAALNIFVLLLGLTLSEAIFAAIPLSFAIRYLLRALKQSLKK